MAVFIQNFENSASGAFTFECVFVCFFFYKLNGCFCNYVVSRYLHESLDPPLTMAQLH